MIAAFPEEGQSTLPFCHPSPLQGCIFNEHVILKGPKKVWGQEKASHQLRGPRSHLSATAHQELSGDWGTLFCSLHTLPQCLGRVQTKGKPTGSKTSPNRPRNFYLLNPICRG